MDVIGVPIYLRIFIAILPAVIFVVMLWLSAKELKEKALYNNMSLEEYLSVMKQIREME